MLDGRQPLNGVPPSVLYTALCLIGVPPSVLDSPLRLIGVLLSVLMLGGSHPLIGVPLHGPPGRLRAPHAFGKRWGAVGRLRLCCAGVPLRGAQGVLALGC